MVRQSGTLASMSDHTIVAPDGWLDYAEWRGDRGTVAGRLLVRPTVRSEAFGTERHILVHVPRSLANGGGAVGRRYPVVYIQDGQNLFDTARSIAGGWRIDEAMQELAEEGTEALIVGIPNAEAATPAIDAGRPLEYSPHPHPGWGGGRADDFLDFVAGTIKPLVDATFPTLPDCAATGIAGSSLGGLVSLYALVTKPETFGFAGVVSPALWFADGRILRENAPTIRPGPRIYLDVGGREGAHEVTLAKHAEMSRRYLKDARTLRDLLLANGFTEGDDLRYVEDPGAPHHESAWAARSPEMLRFLLRPWRTS